MKKVIFTCLAIFMGVSVLLSHDSIAKCKSVDKIDEFTKKRKVMQRGNDATDWPRTYTFNLVYLVDNKEGNTLGMIIEYYAPSWIFVERRKTSLKFLADNELIEFLVEDVDTDVLRDGFINEKFIISLNKDTLVKLISSETLKCRIYGKKGYAEVDDMQKVQACWSEFYEQYLKNEIALN